MSKREEEEEDEEEWDDDEEEELYDSDLTLLPGVGETLAKKLKEMGYDTLWEIAYADINDLAVDAKVSTSTAENMMAAAKKLLGHDE